jgi:hypothetical protein
VKDSYPDVVRRMIAMGPNVGGAEHLVSLDPDDIITTASRATGLNDFGPPTWEEPFRNLLASLHTESKLHVVGRLMCRNDVLRHLETRLRVIDAVKREPSIEQEAVLAPVVITGPARSGTTILQELLALDPELQGPLAWRMAHPFEDERAAEWAESEFDLWGDVYPPFKAIHELSSRLPEECLWLIAPAFDLGIWSACVEIPSFMAYRAVMDPVPTYEFHKLMLQVLQHTSGVRRPWALKSPVHLGRLPALFAVYPDARVILTHRDPAKTVPSMISTVAAGRWVRSDDVDVVGLTATAGMGLRFMLGSIVEQRRDGSLPADQIADFHYMDFLRDPVGAIKSAYDQLGMPFASDLPDRIRAYLDARPQDKHGVHKYSAADFGLDVDEIRKDFAPYIEAANVELENA